MAYLRTTTDDNQKLILFQYDIPTLFLRVQQVSQYHANANRKSEDVDLSIFFSPEHFSYFEQYCKDGLGLIASVYVKSNKRSHTPYSFDTKTNLCSINVSDWGFVKDTLLSTLDREIEDSLINYILQRWYEHLGNHNLKQYFEIEVIRHFRTVKDSLFQFLRKQKPNVYRLYWALPVCSAELAQMEYQMKFSEHLCTQLSNVVMEMKFSEPLCVQVYTLLPEMKFSEPLCVGVPEINYEMIFSEPLCVQVVNYIKSMAFEEAICVQVENFTREMKFTEPICQQVFEYQYSIKFSEPLCDGIPDAAYQLLWSEPICQNNINQLTERT